MYADAGTVEPLRVSLWNVIREIAVLGGKVKAETLVSSWSFSRGPAGALEALAGTEVFLVDRSIDPVAHLKVERYVRILDEGAIHAKLGC